MMGTRSLKTAAHLSVFLKKRTEAQELDRWFWSGFWNHFREPEKQVLPLLTFGKIFCIFAIVFYDSGIGNPINIFDIPRWQSKDVATSYLHHKRSCLPLQLHQQSRMNP
jgi:hypothetical protein